MFTGANTSQTPIKMGNHPFLGLSGTRLQVLTMSILGIYSISFLQQHFCLMALWS